MISTFYSYLIVISSNKLTQNGNDANTTFFKATTKVKTGLFSEDHKTENIKTPMFSRRLETIL